MKLLDVSVVGFRSLASVDHIPVRRPTVLTGQNDGGKSATIAAVRYLLGDHALTEDDVTLSVPGSDLETSGRAPSTRVEGTFKASKTEMTVLQESGLRLNQAVRVRRVTEQDSTRLEVFVMAPADERLRDLPKASFKDLQELRDEFGLSPDVKLKADLIELLSKFADSQTTVELWQPANRAIVEALPTLLYFDGRSTDPDSSVRDAMLASYQSHLSDDGVKENIRTIEKDLASKVEEDANALARHIERRTGIDTIEIEAQVSLKSPSLGARIRARHGSGESIPLTHAGTGRSRRVTLAIWEWTSELIGRPLQGGDALSTKESHQHSAHPGRDFVIAYDEPDTHLDYGNQRKFVDILRQQCSNEHISMLIATHSMNLIDRMDINDVVHYRLDDDRHTVIERLGNDDHNGIDEHLRSIAEGLGLRTSVLLHERCFVGLEGATEQHVFPVLFRIHVGMSMQAMGIVPLACSNNEGALDFAKFLTSHNRNVVFIVDNDSTKHKKNVFNVDKLRSYGIDPGRQVRYLGRDNELEDLFTNEQWSSAANQLWPRTDGRPWEDLDVKLHRDGKFSSGIQLMFQTESEQGPGGKPEMMMQLSETITSAEQIPQDLRTAFDWLCKQAN